MRAYLGAFLGEDAALVPTPQIETLMRCCSDLPALAGCSSLWGVLKPPSFSADPAVVLRALQRHCTRKTLHDCAPALAFARFGAWSQLLRYRV